MAALLPFLAAAVDLFARSRRRHVRLAPAFRAFRSRAAFWLVAGALFELFALAGVWPRGAAAPIAPDSPAATDWPTTGLLGLGVLVAAAWLVARHRLTPRRPVSAEEELAGHTAALLALGVIALVVLAINPFALLLVLPSLHAWLWLPQSRGDLPLQAAVFCAGLLGPAAPALVARGALRARAGRAVVPRSTRLGRLYPAAVGRRLPRLGRCGRPARGARRRGYAPYPEAAERGPRGPIRELVRTVVLAIRRRRVSEAQRRALAG